ncbi:hypothetical protein L218DRAFT_1067389, partial [Marasmius fiardii PR-910]
ASVFTALERTKSVCRESKGNVPVIIEISVKISMIANHDILIPQCSILLSVENILHLSIFRTSLCCPSSEFVPVQHSLCNNRIHSKCSESGDQWNVRKGFTWFTLCVVS